MSLKEIPIVECLAGQMNSLFKCTGYIPPAGRVFFMYPDELGSSEKILQCQETNQQKLQHRHMSAKGFC